MLDFALIEPYLPPAATLEERCLRAAADRHEVDYFILKSIRKQEAGTVGARQRNRSNGTYDHGPWQINTVVISDYAHLGITAEMVMKDVCLNVDIAARHLRAKIDETGDTWKGVAWYHSKTKSFGIPYARKVFNYYIGMVREFRAQFALNTQSGGDA